MILYLKNIILDFRLHVKYERDLPLVEKLLTIIGFGFIRKKENACVLTIY